MVMATTSAAILVTVAQQSATAPPASADTVFGPGGGCSDYTVPTNIRQVRITAIGGHGSASKYSKRGGGGRGGNRRAALRSLREA